MTVRIGGTPDRRRVLATATASTAPTAIGGVADRPLITHGMQYGDVGIDSAVMWARVDRPSRMRLAVATTKIG